MAFADSGIARWLGSSTGKGVGSVAPALSHPGFGNGRLPDVWLARLVALVALLVFVNLAIDSSSSMNFGWDVRVNCAAVAAHNEGRDPYFVKNLKGTKLSYPYLPVTLDVLRPLCSAGVLAGHYRAVYLVLAILCGLLLPGLDTARTGLRDAFLGVLCTLGAFVGFEWTWASGNFTIFTGLLTAVALALLLGRRPPEGNDGQDFSLRLGGAALLGLVTSFKLVFCPVLAALYFLPLPRRRKFILIAVAAGMFILPIIVSMELYGDLFQSWLDAISGRIPGQHSVAMDETNPSLLLLTLAVAEHLGLGGNKAIAFAFYGLAATALVLAPFALLVARAAGDHESPAGGSPLARLDRWLMDHPREAARVTVLAMYALYLCSPRLKEYAFFELAIYAAILIPGLRSTAMAIALTAAVLVPTSAAILGRSTDGSFDLLIAGLVCFWILLLDFGTRRSFGSGAKRLRPYPSADTSPKGSKEPPSGSASSRGRPSPASVPGVSL